MKIEESRKEMVTLKLVQAVLIANVGKIAEDRRIRVEVGIAFDVCFLGQFRR